MDISPRHRDPTHAVESPTLGRQVREMRRQDYEADMTRRRLVYILGGAAAISAVGGLGALILGGKSPQVPTPPQPPANPNPPRPNNGRTTPSTPNSQTQTQQPQPRTQNPRVNLTFNGNYDPALTSISRFVQREGRFVAEPQGTPAQTEQRLEPGRYQLRVVYGDDKTFLVPFQVEAGRDISRLVTIPQFDPNTVRVSGQSITREPWVYVSAAQGNQDKSFWYLPQWTAADQAIFLQRMYLANIPSGQQPSRGAGWETLRRMPCRQDAQRPSPFYAVTRQDGRYVIVPDPREVPTLQPQDMASLPLTSVTLGISQDAINGREFRHANLVGLLQSQIPAGYGIDLPSQDELALAFTGGPVNAPFLRFGDNDTALPAEWSMYDQMVRSQGIQSLRPLGRSRLSPIGVPLYDGGATRFYTNESRVVSGTQFAKVGAMGAEGFVIQDVNADDRDPTLGVAYVIRKAN